MEAWIIECRLREDEEFQPHLELMPGNPDGGFPIARAASMAYRTELFADVQEKRLRKRFPDREFRVRKIISSKL